MESTEAVFIQSMITVSKAADRKRRKLIEGRFLNVQYVTFPHQNVYKVLFVCHVLLSCVQTLSQMFPTMLKHREICNLF